LEVRKRVTKNRRLSARSARRGSPGIVTDGTNGTRRYQEDPPCPCPRPPFRGHRGTRELREMKKAARFQVSLPAWLSLIRTKSHLGSGPLKCARVIAGELRKGARRFAGQICDDTGDRLGRGARALVRRACEQALDHPVWLAGFREACLRIAERLVDETQLPANRSAEDVRRLPVREC